MLRGRSPWGLGGAVYLLVRSQSPFVDVVGRGGSFTARVISTCDDGCQTSVSA